jgi:hypothetical protein
MSEDARAASTVRAGTVVRAGRYIVLESLAAGA